MGQETLRGYALAIFPFHSCSIRSSQKQLQERLVGYVAFVGQGLELSEEGLGESERGGFSWMLLSGANDLVEAFGNLSHLFRCGLPQLCADPLYCERPDLADFHP